MLYAQASSLQCIMNYDNVREEYEGADGGDGGFETYYGQWCEIPSEPTNAVSLFFMASWILTYIIPPLLPSRTLT